MVEPLVRRPFAACSRTMQSGAATMAFDLDLTAGDDAIAQDANAFVIERIPFAVGVAFPQQLQPVFRRIML